MDERALILKITARAYPKLKSYTREDISSLEMDIHFAHKACPLRLKALLKAGDFNFYHDIYGIHRNINRKTYQLDNHFLPRFHRR